MNYSVYHHRKKPEVKQMWYNAALKCSRCVLTKAVSCKCNLLCIQVPLVMNKIHRENIVFGCRCVYK